MTEYLEVTEFYTYQNEFKNWTWKVILTKNNKAFELKPIDEIYDTKEEAEKALEEIKNLDFFKV